MNALVAGKSIPLEDNEFIIWHGVPDRRTCAATEIRTAMFLMSAICLIGCAGVLIMEPANVLKIFIMLIACTLIAIYLGVTSAGQINKYDYYITSRRLIIDTNSRDVDRFAEVELSEIRVSDVKTSTRKKHITILGSGLRFLYVDDVSAASALLNDALIRSRGY